MKRDFPRPPAQDEAERRLERIEAIAHIGYWEWDAAANAMTLSREVCRIFGQPAHWRPRFADVLAATVEDDRDWLAIAIRVLIADRSRDATFDFRIDAAGRPVDLHSSARIEYKIDGSPRYAIGTVQDVTELKGYQRRLQSLSFYDPVTELPNRRLFAERLQQAIDEAAQSNAGVVVMILDLDRFKDVNETLGHDAGDIVLREAAQRLRSCIREYDTVGRMGGDEFGFILPRTDRGSDLGNICGKILGTMAEAYQVDATEVYLTGSIGVARYPDDGQTTSELLQHADASLHQAKDTGRNSFRFYAADLTEQVSQRLSLAAHLHRAEANGELELRYQPQVDLGTGELLGAEALLRWNHPEAGVIMPDRFIGIAEDTGLIVGIGQWVLRTACLAAAQWNRGRRRPLKIAVNVSSRQFRSADLVATFADILAETGCLPAWLEIEITESLLVDDSGEVLAMIGQLHALGFSIAIDDFGTGYSALNYLIRLPAKALKIDRSFIEAMADQREAVELVKAIIAMGRSLNLMLVAEGIEDRTQERFLKLHGCHSGQGYLYGKPMPGQDFWKLHASTSSSP